MGSGLPEVVHRFLVQFIDSIEQLEILLLLHRQRQELTAAQIATELRTNTDSCEQRASGLVAHGLAEKAGTGPTATFQFRDVGDNAAKVSAVAAAYSERRYSVINLIATKHLDRIRSFADAFKLKKDD